MTLIVRPGYLAEGDPSFSNVSLLLHGNGTNGSTTITDSSPTPKTVTAVVNAQISTTQSKFGGASIAFDGAGDYCTTATSNSFEFGTGDATIEAWVYPSALTGIRVMIEMRPFGNPATGVVFYLNGATLSVAKTRIDVLQAAGTLVINSWHHIAWSRQGSSNRLFLNGNLVNTTTDSTSYPLTTVYLGAESNSPPTQFFNGYIDDLRITKGIARYTATFTPPDAPFPDAQY